MNVRAVEVVAVVVQEAVVASGQAVAALTEAAVAVRIGAEASGPAVVSGGAALAPEWSRTVPCPAWPAVATIITIITTAPTTTITELRDLVYLN